MNHFFSGISPIVLFKPNPAIIFNSTINYVTFRMLILDIVGSNPVVFKYTN